MENGSGKQGENVEMGVGTAVEITMSLSYAMSKRNFVVLDKVQHSVVGEENSKKKWYGASHRNNKELENVREN